MNKVAQFFGIIAIVIWLLSILQNTKKNISLLQFLSNIFYGIQYFILGAFSASGMNITSSIRCLIIYLNERKNKKTSIFISLLACLIIFIITFFTYNGLLSLIPVFVTICYTYSLWQSNIKVTYIIVIAMAFIWIIYNALVGAYICVSGNICEIIFGIISIIKYKKKH